MSQIPPLEPFDCEGDPASLGLRWEKWKRGFELFLVALNINDLEKKGATLLHVGGLSLQEIYYNIPDEVVSEGEKDKVDVYKSALKKLDEFFLPHQSKIYERHLFRLLKQEQGETFEKFLVRLRHQSSKCKFASEDDNLIDQIVEKCCSKDLRKKILTLGDSVTLAKIILEANAIEAVERQLIDYGHQTQTSTINKIDFKKVVSEKTDCSRCGSSSHNADSSSCPAKSKQCLKCGFNGHFRSQCKTRISKRKPPNPNQYPNKKPRLALKNDDKPKPKTLPQKTNVDYIFHIDDDATLACYVGGVKVDMVIDSGSKCNILSESTWDTLKQQNISVMNQVSDPDKTFVAYGSNTPLEVTGSFDTDIQVGDQVQTGTFFVVKNGTRNLLGKDTAIALHVLKLGLEVNSVSEQSFPKIKNLQLEISINKAVKPVAQPCRRVPIPLEEKIRNKIDHLLKLDIIEPVTKPSGWVSPIVPVLKSDGDVRICVDMRNANKAIVRENHPLPTMDQLLTKFKKARLFSKLDIKDAFHQVEISDDSRDITTFITSQGLYRYKRLMFGISCAPEHFQKIVERILLPCDGAVNFIDDIVVYGQDEAEHNARLKQVLDIFKTNNILLNQEKCVFNVSRIQFLGHELSSEGVKPLDKYVKVVESFREPTTVEEIQSFLGLVNYVNKWIPNMATESEPLRRLLTLKLGKNANISSHWGPEQSASFLALKRSLSNIRTLGYYDPNDKTTVMADASPVGLGAVLIQSDNNGSRVIAYGNKSLTDVEKRYCQTEKEALALVWAVEHFRMYLFGKETFDLVTDHKPLEVIFGNRTKSCARIERWVLRLQSYNYKVVYKPGKTNIVDCLSRLSTTNITQPFEDEHHINQIVEYARPCAIGMDEITDESVKDQEIQLVKEALHSGSWDPSVNTYRIFKAELWTHGDLLLRGTKIVIPLSLRPGVLNAAHEGHPGIGAMKARLRGKVWWPKIDSEAEKRVKNCKGCTLVSAPNRPMPLTRHFRDQDKIMKEKGRIYADRKRKAETTLIDNGEKVYVKNLVKENKLTTNFNPTPHTVINSTGSEYCLRNDETGQELRRNIIHLKRVEGKWEVCGENNAEDESENKSEDTENSSDCDMDDN